jgi:uncharacterized protein (TIGR02391 family)
MNIKTFLEPKLWDEIENNYKNEDYTGAITNAIYYLRDIIREKANLDLDSKKLITEAFSQNNPKIKINKLQTETEKNEQAGLRDSLLGIFGLIRNTRTHKKHKDTQEDAFTIILHINYLLKFINKAKSSFSIDSFINNVYDEYFEQTEEYAKLLILEIPDKQLEDTVFNLYGRMSDYIYDYDEGYSYNNYTQQDIEENYRKLESLKLVFTELIDKISEDNQKEIFEKITDDLKNLNKCNELFWKVYLILDRWELLGKRVKLRIIKIITQYMQDPEHKEYQKKIFLKGWSYFDKDTKNKIEKLFVDKESDYYIENNELKFKYFRKTKSTIPEIDTNDDEIPF